MNRTPVTSSSIASIGYEQQTRHLEIEFINGRVYKYKRVPARVAARFMASGSFGSFFHAEIINRFDYDELTLPQDVPVQEKVRRDLDM